MAVTQDQVDAAERDAQTAQDKADAAQTTADESRESARQSREAADKARRDADSAASNADSLESAAAQRRAEADSAAGACQRARADVASAEQELANANANAQAVHAQYPGECNPDTEAADTRVANAQSRVQSASKTAGSTCADAEQKRRAAEQAQTEATNARASANTAAEQADLAKDQAELDEATARTDQASAQQAVVDAATAKSSARTLREEFERQNQAPAPDPNQPPPPKEPNHADPAGHSGVPTPPSQGSGVSGSSLFDFNFTCLSHSYKLNKDKWEKAPILLEITRGWKHRHTLGINYTFVGGARSEEVAGPDTKVTMGGDWRQISTLRYERNTGIKVESVVGSVDETTLAAEKRNTPVVRQDKNPTTYSSKGPEFESITTKAINDFKATAYDKYTTVRLKASAAKHASDDAYYEYSNWNRNLASIRQEMDDLTGKYTELQEQCKNFTIKSSGFVKMIASASMKLKAGKLKGNIDKIKVVAKSLAEFKGTVKLGG